MVKKYKISEIAKIFGIKNNKVRFYEKKGLLNPTRGEENEYRLYNEDDILRLQSILLYRSLGLSIEDIKDILDSNEKNNYLSHFNNQWKLVNDEIQKLNIIRNSLETAIDRLYEDNNLSTIKPEIDNIIKSSNELYKIKNGWNDKWDFNDWAKNYDVDIKKDKGALPIYKNYDLILDTVFNEVNDMKLNSPKILDIGVGTGNLSERFLKKGYDIIGIDQSREMLFEAKKKMKNLRVRLGEFLKIPYENREFDAIVSTYAFHHLNDKEKAAAIEEMVRVLKNDGVIVIGDLMFENEKSKNEFIRKCTKKQVEEIEDEYYSDVEFLKSEARKHDKTLRFIKIDDLNCIVTITK